MKYQSGIDRGTAGKKIKIRNEKVDSINVNLKFKE